MDASDKPTSTLVHSECRRDESLHDLAFGGGIPDGPVDRRGQPRRKDGRDPGLLVREQVRPRPVVIGEVHQLVGHAPTLPAGADRAGGYTYFVTSATVKPCAWMCL